jgi:hypothetical protein
LGMVGKTCCNASFGLLALIKLSTWTRALHSQFKGHSIEVFKP